MNVVVLHLDGGGEGRGVPVEGMDGGGGGGGGEEARGGVGVLRPTSKTPIPKVQLVQAQPVIVCIVLKINGLASFIDGRQSAAHLIRRLRLDDELVLEGVRLKVLLEQLVLDPGGVEVKVVSEVVQPLHPLLLLHVGLLQVALHLVTCLQE